MSLTLLLSVYYMVYFVRMQSMVASKQVKRTSNPFETIWRWLNYNEIVEKVKTRIGEQRFAIVAGGGICRKT